MTDSKNPTLAMAKCMSQAGADGYTGLLYLYHHSTTQLIVQWTGCDIPLWDKVQAEQYLLTLVTGCGIGQSTPEGSEMANEEAALDAEITDRSPRIPVSLNFGEPMALDFETVKSEPVERTISAEGYIQDDKSNSTEKGPIGDSDIDIPGVSSIHMPTDIEVSAGSAISRSELSFLSARSNALNDVSRPVTVRDCDPHALDRPDNPSYQRELQRGNSTGQTGYHQRNLQTANSTGYHQRENQMTNTTSQPGYQQRDLQIRQLLNDSCFRCKQCDFSTTSSSTLDRHSRAAHSGPGDKPYHCPLCDFKCSYSHVINRHISSKHTRDKPYQCRVCSKRFSRSDSLADHMKVHDNGRRKSSASSNSHLRMQLLNTAEEHGIGQPMFTRNVYSTPRPYLAAPRTTINQFQSANTHPIPHSGFRDHFSHNKDAELRSLLQLNSIAQQVAEHSTHGVRLSSKPAPVFNRVNEISSMLMKREQNVLLGPDFSAHTSTASQSPITGQLAAASQRASAIDPSASARAVFPSSESEANIQSTPYRRSPMGGPMQSDALTLSSLIGGPVTSEPDLSSLLGGDDSKPAA